MRAGTIGLAALALATICAAAVADDGPPPAAPPRFRVDVEGVKGSFTEVEGLSTETDAVDYRSGSEDVTRRKIAGLQQTGAFRLTRPVSRDGSLYQWRRAVVDGAPQRRTVTISVADFIGAPAFRYPCWPVDWAGPAPGAPPSAQVAEHVDLVCAGLPRAGEATTAASDVSRVTAGRPPSALELAVLAEINAARADPSRYASRLLLGGPGAADAIAFLRRQPQVPPLAADPRLAGAAARLAADQGPRGGDSHVASDGSQPSQRMQAQGVQASVFAEVIAVAQSTASGAVVQLIIDLPGPNHPHRTDLFDPMLAFAGVACGSNARFGEMCVVDLTGAQSAVLADAGPPEASDCGGAFYEASGKPLAAPPSPHSRATEAALKVWIDGLRNYYANAHPQPAGAALDAGKAALCTDWRIKREIRADDTNAQSLQALEGAGPAPPANPFGPPPPGATPRPDGAWSMMFSDGSTSIFRMDGTIQTILPTPGDGPTPPPGAPDRDPLIEAPPGAIAESAMWKRLSDYQDAHPVAGATRSRRMVRPDKAGNALSGLVTWYAHGAEIYRAELDGQGKLVSAGQTSEGRSLDFMKARNWGYYAGGHGLTAATIGRTPDGGEYFSHISYTDEDGRFLGFVDFRPDGTVLKGVIYKPDGDISERWEGPPAPAAAPPPSAPPGLHSLDEINAELDQEIADQKAADLKAWREQYPPIK